MKKIQAFKKFNPVLGMLLLMFLLLTGCDERREISVTDNSEENQTEASDMGGSPMVLDIEQETLANGNYRQARWTGEHMQMTLMTVKPGGQIDLEMHSNIDQFLRIEQGEAQVLMGKSEDSLTFDRDVSDDWAVFIPAGYYHQVKNTGKEDLKLYSIYSPAIHPKGTLHRTYDEAKEQHEKQHAGI